MTTPTENDTDDDDDDDDGDDDDDDDDDDGNDDNGATMAAMIANSIGDEDAGVTIMLTKVMMRKATTKIPFNLITTWKTISITTNTAKCVHTDVFWWIFLSNAYHQICNC